MVFPKTGKGFKTGLPDSGIDSTKPTLAGVSADYFTGVG
jgi:hypothetical protein